MVQLKTAAIVLSIMNPMQPHFKLVLGTVNSVAIGSKNTALGSSALAVGNEAKAKKMSESVAIGHEAP